MSEFRIRRATADDLPFLREMGYEAAFWQPRGPRPPIDEALSDVHLARYLSGWGRPGDAAVLAEESGDPIGAAWYRLFRANEPGYGFIDESIPELSIAVREDRRGRGVGGALLAAIIDRARAEGYASLSLSVERTNPALSLYERCGFVKVEADNGSWTMRLDLEP